MDTNALVTLIDLLKRPSPRPSNESNKPSSSSLSSSQNQESVSQSQSQIQESRPTIFDLQRCDRYRILKIIEELLDTQEEADQLKQKLENQKSEFREKRSALIKKLDVLSEKHEKSQSDIQLLKERHSQTLIMLEEKITKVSQKFEASVSEIDRLRKANCELKKENAQLLQLSSEATSKLANLTEENSKLKVKLKEVRYREKSLKRHVKNHSRSDIKDAVLLSSNDKLYSLEKIHSSSDKHRLERSIDKFLTRHMDSGAGDFVTRGSINLPSALGLTTIKSPTKTSLEKDTLSTPDFLGKPNSTTKSAQISSGSNTENIDTFDSEILKNLFFRF